MSLPLAKLAYLDGIRGFVAAGRRMSITEAADDLCLTQSAVSRQILALEEQLGVKLFVRGHRSLRFTVQGARLFRSADGALQQLQDVLGEVRAAGTAQPVTLDASIGVTGLWLLPRLNGFQQLHPGVDLRISANNRVSDLRQDGVDLAIRYTTARLAPAGATRLFDEYLAPVTHPSLATHTRRAAKLPLQWPLLEFDQPTRPWLQWRSWLGDKDWAARQARGVIHFNMYDQLIQAALASQGIALGRLALIHPLLDAGKLVLLAPGKKQESGDGGHAYWLIQAQKGPSTEVQRVADWIRDESCKTAQWKPST